MQLVDLDDVVGVVQREVDVAPVVDRVEGDVRADLRVDQRRTGRDGLARVDNGGQGLVIDDHRVGRVAGGLPGLGRHGHHRFARETSDPAGREAAVDLGVPGRPLELHVRVGQRLDLVGEQAAQVAGHPLGAGGVHPRDAGVGVGGADEHDVAEPRDRGVVTELALRLQ
jgi:hypothetical protein